MFQKRAGSEGERLSAVAAGLEAEISQLRAQLKLQNDRLEVANSDLNAGQQLHAKGYLTTVDLRRRQMAALEQQQAKFNVSQIDAQLSQMGEALALAEPLAEAGKALAAGQLEKAAEELERLEAPQLDRQTEKAVKEKLLCPQQ